jgi:hypothetical protein
MDLTVLTLQDARRNGQDGVSGVNQTDGTHGTILRVHPARRVSRRDA